MRRLITLAVLSLAIGAMATADAQKARRGGIKLTAKTFPKWLAFIRPTDHELAYERIGWRNAFWPAVEEAKRLGRPILLWTMNGHPLGCT